MICDTADIGRSDFEPEYITKMLGSESHTMRFIVYPETSIQDTLINRIEWTITIERRDHFTIIDEMKSVIIRES